jgi:hypothetical protein
MGLYFGSIFAQAQDNDAIGAWLLPRRLLTGQPPLGSQKIDLFDRLQTRAVCGYGLDRYGYGSRLRYLFETRTRVTGWAGFSGEFKILTALVQKVSNSCKQGDTIVDNDNN